MKFIKLKSTVFAVLLLPILLNASIWLEEKKEGEASCCAGVSEKKAGYKELTVKNGTFKKSKQLNDINGSEAWVRDFDDIILKGKILKDTIEVATPQKGSYHIFFETKNVENGILKVDATTTRIYNKDADIKESIVKEIRGKTVGSYYDKPP
ncbi:MAG: hypothetical protein PHQ18_05660, partial [Patescibacteria group bacterium]|nr:hypothetical protein [Patescibacteria group bacterium]